MPAKMVALFTKPEDVEAFENHYNEVHAPLVKKMPNLDRLEVTRFIGAPVGEPRYYLMAEMYFKDKATMFASAGSEEGMACGKDAFIMSNKTVHMMFATVE